MREKKRGKRNEEESTRTSIFKVCVTELHTGRLRELLRFSQFIELIAVETQVIVRTCFTFSYLLGVGGRSRTILAYNSMVAVVRFSLSSWTDLANGLVWPFSMEQKM